MQGTINHFHANLTFIGEPGSLPLSVFANASTKVNAACVYARCTEIHTQATKAFLSMHRQTYARDYQSLPC